MIGDWDEGSSEYGPFFTGGCLPQCPHVVVKAVEADVAQHMSAQGLGTPLIESPTVAGTLAAITMCQGALIEGDGDVAFGAASGAVVTMVGECKGKGVAVTVARGGEDADDSLMLIQSLQAEVAAVKDVAHDLEGTNAKLKDVINQLKDANEGLKGDVERLQDGSDVLQGALSSLQEEAALLKIRVSAVNDWVEWLVGVKVACERAGKYALALCDSGVADVAALGALGRPRAGELLAAVGMNKIETLLVLKQLY